MRYRLDTDHQNAGMLEKLLNDVDKIEIAHDRRDINFVFFKNNADAQLDTEAFVEYMHEKYFNQSLRPRRVFPIGNTLLDNKEHIQYIADTIKEFYA